MSVLFVNAQNKNIIQGTVKDEKSGMPLPYILVQSDSNFTFSDLNGNFTLGLSNNLQIKITNSDYKELIYKVDTSLHTLFEFELLRISKRKFKSKEQKKIRPQVSEIFSNNKKNSIFNKQTLRYNTYNKLSVKTESEEQNYNFFNYIRQLLPNRWLNINYEPNHHIFIMESYTQKFFRNFLYQKEIILKTNTSGIAKSSMFSLTSDLQQTSVYDKFIFFNFTNYSNPLNTKSYKHYNYEFSDTLKSANSTKIIVKFYPKNLKLFDAIQGFFVWNLTAKYVEYIQIIPLRESKSSYFQLMQVYQKDSATRAIIPIHTTTLHRYTNLNHKNIVFQAKADTYWQNFSILKNDSLKIFDENIYEYQNAYNTQYDSASWKNLRTEQFSKTDTNTFLLYDQIGKIKNLERFINLGRDIYNGKIPLPKVNIILNKVVNYNQVEGLRLGMGIETKESFSKRFHSLLYGGYGFRDELPKYGTSVGYHISKKYKLWGKVSYSKDVNEPGKTDLIFDRQQFTSESFRKYQLQLLDKVEKYNFSLQSNPIKYLQLASIFTEEYCSPYYTYTYDSSWTKFKFRELAFNINYAFGRQFIKYADQQIFFKDRYPVLNFQVIHSLTNSTHPFEYTKYDFKLTYNFRILNKGHHNLQASAGYINGEVPYYKLYNSKGSFSGLYTTINNSFETMRYNEFASNKYLVFFYLVNFGRLNRVGKFKPTFSLAHNMGWSQLNNSSKHEGFVLQDMNKGYFETGFTFGDIVRYNFYGLRIGLGLSLYYRYGPYSFTDERNNTVLKLATSFRL